MTNNIQKLKTYHDLIVAIVYALEARDLNTSRHSVRVASMTEALCKYLKLSDDEMTIYHIAAHLHDIGKIGIDDSVLRKNGELNEEEWTKIKSHTIIGYEILNKIECFEKIAEIVKSHHERWNGTGYPEGLKGEGIPLGARIIAIADSVDAMLSDRPYRKGISKDNCFMELKRNMGIMYSPDLVNHVLENWNDFLERRNREEMVV